MKGGEDTKVLSVPVSDARYDGYHDITDVHPHMLREIQEFFETYKRLEPHKWIRFKAWKNAKDTTEIVTQTMEAYKKKVELHK
jgi:inorganic pyrophosphatase